MVTLHEVITFVVSMQISISSLQTHNVNRCGRSRHLARNLSFRIKRISPPPIATLFPYTTLFRSHELEQRGARPRRVQVVVERHAEIRLELGGQDRKSTRLNSSHMSISYAVFCLKKKTSFGEKAQSQEEAEKSKCF